MYTVLKADTIINGTGELPVANKAIVLEDDRILDVVPVDSLDSYADVPVIDPSGGTLMLGLIDGNAHLSMTPKLHDCGGKMSVPLPMLVARSTRNLRKVLLCGVTITKRLGDKDLMNVQFSKAMPNVLIPIVVLSTLQVARSILHQSSLTFLGLGAQPPDPSWGGMASTGRRFLQSEPHIVLVPSIAIMLVVLAFNLFGDGLRDGLDPRLQTHD